MAFGFRKTATAVKNRRDRYFPFQIFEFCHTFIFQCYTVNLSFSNAKSKQTLHELPPAWAGSSVDIATGYGLHGLGIESRWRRDFPHLPRPALGPTQPPVQRVPGLSRGKERPGRDADPPPLLVPWSRKCRAIPLLPLWAVRPVQSLSACTREHFTFTFLHSPYSHTTDKSAS